MTDPRSFRIRRALRRVGAPAALLLLGALAGCAIGPAPRETGIDRSAFDPAVAARDDLYRHVNGGWMRRTELPADKAHVGALEQVHERTQRQLRTLIEAAQARRGDADAQRIGDLYASFMDEAAVERAGLAPLAGELAAIDAVADRTQLAALFARLDRLGVGMPLGVYVGQDDRDATRYVPSLHQAGLGMPNRDYFIVEGDARFRAAREAYAAYLARLLVLGGAAETEASGSAAAVLGLETALAQAHWSAVENRDPVKGYNRVALAGLPAAAPGLDWPAWLGAAGIAGRIDAVVVRQPSYLKALGELVGTTPLATWKAYARTHLLSAYAPYLGRAWVEARFAFVGTVLSGTTENRPRWQRGVQLVDQAVGEALGRRYVAEHFPPASKARIDALVANLLAASRDSIQGLDWLGPETRREALAKLAKFNVKVGYPTRWIDYATLEIRAGDLAGNVLRARRFESDRQLARLGRPIDRDEWALTPQTVNAYYDPSMNEIVFPAAFLQPPSFDPAADDAVNYGAVGAVIGHEISHGFDDQGSQYDGDGNLRDWWTADDRARFAAKTSALVAQYGAYEALPGYHVNGALTLGENIADNAGLALAWKAWQRSLGGRPSPVIDGLSGEQRFYAGFAQAWRSKSRDAALLAQIKADPHAPDEFRVNGTVRNQTPFHTTYGTRPGDGMYLAPAERVSIW